MGDGGGRLGAPPVGKGVAGAVPEPVTPEVMPAPPSLPTDEPAGGPLRSRGGRQARGPGDGE